MREASYGTGEIEIINQTSTSSFSSFLIFYTKTMIFWLYGLFSPFNLNKPFLLTHPPKFQHCLNLEIHTEKSTIPWDK